MNTGKTGGFWTGDPSSAFTGNSPDRVLFVGKENIPYDSVKHIEDNGSRTSENVYAVLSKVDSNNIDGTLSGWKVIWKNPSFKLSEIGFPDNQSVSDTAPKTSLFPEPHWQRKPVMAQATDAAAEALEAGTPAQQSYRLLLQTLHRSRTTRGRRGVSNQFDPYSNLPEQIRHNPRGAKTRQGL